MPVRKASGSALLAGSANLEGSLVVRVSATGEHTTLARIAAVVERAQSSRASIQRLADRVSSIFVPVVVLIACLAAAGWIWAPETLRLWQSALTPLLWHPLASLSPMSDAVAAFCSVLIVACPCAMGLATPAAIAVGMGRAARSGILFRNATSLENFRTITQVVFDKTGTLTTGGFKMSAFDTMGMAEEEWKTIIYSLEKYSNHPIAQCITATFKMKSEIRWGKIEEIKGLGMKGTDKEGNTYWAGSYKLVADKGGEGGHNVYVLKNDKLIGWIDVQDEIRTESKEVISYLKSKNLKTILLSGDRKEKCDLIATSLGIDEVIAEKTPEEKLTIISQLNATTPTAMVGDGINDAPALAKATIGISLSEASQLAIQSAQVVLMNSGIKNLPLALGLGKHTYATIRQNLFWAFFYNIIAIPIAALGFLTPTFGALVMGMSDVVLAVNSVRLFFKKVI
jgi:Cu+-exporting ATPase